MTTPQSMTAPQAQKDIEAMDMYSRECAYEAMRRGIDIDVIDAQESLFVLSHSGRSHKCIGSLSDRSSAIDVKRVRDKSLANKMLRAAGYPAPDQIVADEYEKNLAFLKKHGAVVVKPATGEKGYGVSVDIRTPEDLEMAIEHALLYDVKIVIEQYIPAVDLRIIVIDYKAMAAAVRTKPEVIGDGVSTVKQLVEQKNQKLIDEGKPQFQIPVDEEYNRVLEQEGHTEEEVLEKDVVLEVRKSANVHAGGVKHDVTDDIHPDLMRQAEKIARLTNLRVTGVDFLVEDIKGSDFYYLESGERPSLSNYDRQRVIPAYIDSLFPETAET